MSTISSINAEKAYFLLAFLDAPEMPNFPTEDEYSQIRSMV